MLPSAKALFRGNLWEKWVFQEDNDPKHIAILNREWIQKNKIRRMDWPAQSPDLNPIENLWSILDQRCKSRKPKNEDELFDVLKKAMEALPTRLLQSLVQSMHSKVQGCN